MNDFQDHEWQFPEQDPGRSTRWKAVLLLVVMLSTVVATPIVIFYRLSASNNPEEPPVESRVDRETVSDDINRIAYINLEGQLATVSPDAGNGRVLTDGRRQFQFPAWSPDGQHVAVISEDSLYTVVDRENGSSNDDIVKLYQNMGESPFYLYWSPDSTKISFLANHPLGIGLHIAQVDEETSQNDIVTVGQPLYWDWSPSGESMIIHTGVAGANGRLALVKADGTMEDELAEPGFFQAPGFSFSGLYKAFAEITESGDRQLTIQDAAGNVQNAVPHSGQLAIGWSPSAELLAYASPDPDSRALYGPMRLLDPVDGDSRFLNSDETLAFFWSPNGRKIAYLATSSFDREGVQVLAKSRQAKPMHSDETQQSKIRLDLMVVDIDSGENKFIVSFTPTEVFLRQFLPFFDQYALSHQLWSPDSDALILPMMIEGVPHIMNVPIDGRDALPVAAGVIGFWSHQ